MDAKNITYLPSVPVRYSYAQPSMSRRGGVRLHPVADGRLNMEASQQYLRTRDFAGNKLRDHVNPTSGMFTHCTSLIESSPLNPVGTAPEDMKSGVSGADNAATRLLPKKTVHTPAGRVYLDEAGQVIRTTDMGDSPVIARPRIADPSTTTKPSKGRRSVSARAPKRAVPQTPGGTGPSGRITDADVEAFVRAVAEMHGRTVSIVTPNMLRDGREALKALRKQAEKVLARRTSRGK
jgi:hypothetical protein